MLIYTPQMNEANTKVTNETSGGEFDYIRGYTSYLLHTDRVLWMSLPLAAAQFRPFTRQEEPHDRQPSLLERDEVLIGTGGGRGDCVPLLACVCCRVRGKSLVNILMTR